MTLKVSAGVSRKMGLPHYSSVGASCHVEMELDPTLLQKDVDAFHDHVRNAYRVCCQAVEEELERFKASRSPSPGAVHSATERQLGYLDQLVSQIDGMGHQQLEALARRMYGKGFSELSQLETSGLIGTLEGARDGRVDLPAILEGTPHE